MDIKNIFRSIRPLKRKIHLNTFIFYLSFAFTLGGGVSLLLSTAAVFYPVLYLFNKILLIYGATLLAAAIYSLFSGPSYVKALKTADSLGLKERLVTAYELRDSDEPLAMVQRNDALKSLKEIDFRKLYRIVFPVRLLMAAFVLLMLTFASFFIPSPSKASAEHTERVLGEIKKQAESIEKERKDLAGRKAVNPRLYPI